MELEVGALFSVLPFDFANTDRPWNWKDLPLAFCNLSNTVPIQGPICQQHVEGFYRISFSPFLLYFILLFYVLVFIIWFPCDVSFDGFYAVVCETLEVFVRGAADVVAALRVIAWRFLGGHPLSLSCAFK